MSFHYSNGTEDLGELSAKEIQRRINENPEGQHLVWREEMDGWKNAKDLKEFAYQEPSAPYPQPESEPEHEQTPEVNHKQETSKPEEPARTTQKAEVTKQSRKGLLIGIGAVVVVVIVAILLLQKSTYEKGVGLLLEGKYEDAMATFKEAEPGDDDYQRCVVGSLVAKMSKLYSEEEYDEAHDILYSTYGLEEPDDREEYGTDYLVAYQVHLAPSDPLYKHASTISILIEAQTAIATIERFLSSELSDMDRYYSGEAEINIVLPSVLETGEYVPQYYPVDTMTHVWDEPYVLHTKLDKLEYPTMLAQEVSRVKETLEGLKPKVAKKTEEYHEYVEAIEAYTSAMSFSSANEAAQWLVRGGVWMGSARNGQAIGYDFDISGGNLYLHMALYNSNGYVAMDIGTEKLVFESIDANTSTWYVASQRDYAVITRSMHTCFLWGYGGKNSMHCSE